VDCLPDEFVKNLSRVMMPTVFTRIKELWLDTAVPSSLSDMEAYQKSLALVSHFATVLESLNWPAADGFHDWCSDTHKIWLTKRKETCLDWTRHHLELGKLFYRIAQDYLGDQPAFVSLTVLYPLTLR
jgi:centromere/kinetochore protein ZW10